MIPSGVVGLWILLISGCKYMEYKNDIGLKMVSPVITAILLVFLCFITPVHVYISATYLFSGRLHEMAHSEFLNT